MAAVQVASSRAVRLRHTIAMSRAAACSAGMDALGDPIDEPVDLLVAQLAAVALGHYEIDRVHGLSSFESLMGRSSRQIVGAEGAREQLAHRLDLVHQAAGPARLIEQLAAATARG